MASDHTQTVERDGYSIGNSPFIPEDSVKIALNVLYLVWFLLYFYPGGAYLSQIDTRVLGWPFFALWAIVIGPIIFVTICALDMRYKTSRDEAQRNAGMDGESR